MLNKKHDNVVVVFAKRPVKGKVKTRIAEETSEDFAFELAKCCFIDLLNKINNSDYFDLVVATDSLADLRWFQENYSINGFTIDAAPSLSDKLNIIFKTLTNVHGYSKAILIPMDIPFIKQEDLITGFARLDNNDYVFGPEVNGGVYLMGLKDQGNTNIFSGVRWSTSNSFNDLSKNCQGHSIYNLNLKNDLNLPIDLINLKEEISHSCPILYNFLEKSNYFAPLHNKYINYDDLSIGIPVVVNIVERNNNGQTEILLQTRHKPNIDPANSGKFELPSGLIKRFESAQIAAVRETLEETSVLSEIMPSFLASQPESNGQIIEAYQPYICLQQLSGDRSYVALVFVSRYLEGEPKENIEENRNPHWIDVAKLTEQIKNKPETFFGLSLVALKKYLKIS